jgi:glycosyltransferase involved in cell wall biosynthesis
LKIMQVSYKAPDGGGVATHVSVLSKQLEARGHRVIDLRLTESGVGEPVETPHSHRLPWSYGPVQGQLLRPALRRVLSEAKPDLIHVHGCFTTLSSVLLADLRRHAPVVGTLHDIRPFCYLMTRRFTPTGAQCDRRCGIGCFSSGCVRPDEILDVLRLPRRWWVDGLNLRGWRQLDRVVVPSSYLRDLALQHEIPARCIRLVPHGTAVLPEPPPKRNSADPPLVLFLGNLLDYKGPALLVAALQRLRERAWEAILIGDGPMRGMLEDEVGRHELSGRVRFYGLVDDRDVINRLLSRARLLALPSTIPESFSLAGIEALAMGTPVVSFGLGGLGEWLRDGENGLIAADRDVEDLARQIGRLLDDPALAQRMGQQGHELVARSFTSDLALERLLAVYEEVTGTAG